MCTERQKPCAILHQGGVSMIELVMFIVIVSAGVVGILAAINATTQKSADPMARKQALAIAESLLEEVQLMPFTYCDPDDPQASTATSATVGVAGVGCTSAATVEGIGPEAGETRYSTPQFDNVNDYHGFSMLGFKDIANVAVLGLTGYNASVATTAVALGGIAANDVNGRPQVLRIVVTVTPPSGSAISLEGYRTRYAPQATP